MPKGNETSTAVDPRASARRTRASSRLLVTHEDLRLVMLQVWAGIRPSATRSRSGSTEIRIGYDGGNPIVQQRVAPSTISRAAQRVCIPLSGRSEPRASPVRVVGRAIRDWRSPHNGASGPSLTWETQPRPGPPASLMQQVQSLAAWRRRDIGGTLRRRLPGRQTFSFQRSGAAYLGERRYWHLSGRIQFCKVRKLRSLQRFSRLICALAQPSRGPGSGLAAGNPHAAVVENAIVQPS